MEEDYDRPVEAPPALLADLRRRAETMDTDELTEYAMRKGLKPPAEPAGYEDWEIVVAFEDEGGRGPGELWWATAE